MHSYKKFAAAVGILAAAACLPAGTAQAAEYTMRLSHQFASALPISKNIDQFAADVKEATKGRVEVQLFGGSQLFKPTQQHIAVATGKVEAAVMLDASMGGAVPEINVALVPYLLDSRDKIEKFAGSDATRILDAKLQAKGLTTIAWMVESTTSIVTSQKKPLIKPSDFEGVKIRGVAKLPDMGLVAMGAAPTPMAGPEVYQALQTGIIDAAVTSVAGAYARKYYEVQKYGVVTNSSVSNAILVVNPAWWNALPADLREAVKGAAHKAEQRALAINIEETSEMIKRLRTKGMELTVLTPVQEKTQADVMQPPVLKEYTGLGPDAVKIIDIVNKL